MPKMRDFVRGDPAPTWWAEQIEEHIGLVTTNFKLTRLDATHIRVPAGTDNDQVGIGIEGKWRYVTANVDRAHPGGAAATFDIFVTAADNDIVGTPLPNTDNTVYAFELRIVAHNTTPGGVDIFRKVGELVWDGAAIEAIRQTVPLVTGAMLADGAIGAGTGILAERQPDGSVLLSFSEAGDFVPRSGNFGFHGAPSVAQSAGWSVANASTLKSLDINNFTPRQVARVLGELIGYLISRGDLAA